VCRPGPDSGFPPMSLGVYRHNPPREAACEEPVGGTRRIRASLRQRRRGHCPRARHSQSREGFEHVTDRRTPAWKTLAFPRAPSGRRPWMASSARKSAFAAGCGEPSPWKTLAFPRAPSGRRPWMASSARLTGCRGRDQSLFARQQQGLGRPGRSGPQHGTRALGGGASPRGNDPHGEVDRRAPQDRRARRG